MHLDEFESQFKSAVKVPYVYEEISLGSVALVCDVVGDAAQGLLGEVQGLVPAMAGRSAPKWEVFDRNGFGTVSDLLSKLTDFGPDLVIAERNLKLDREDDLVYGLTNYIDALTQVLAAPVLLLPSAGPEDSARMVKVPTSIMVETNHLVGDSRLINWGVRFAEPNRSLYLTHIEDGVAFANYIDAIGRIPEIDTELAEKTLRETLLKLPHDFVSSAREDLGSRFPEMDVGEIVRFGSALSDYESIVTEKGIDLLILNTKEAGQLAMNGVAYAIAVEFKDRALLLL